MINHQDLEELLRMFLAADKTSGPTDRMRRPCPDCGRFLRRGKDNIKWFCDNPRCPVIYVIYDPLWLKPIKIAREARRRHPKSRSDSHRQIQAGDEEEM